MLLAITILLLTVVVKVRMIRKRNAWSGEAEALIKLERWEDALAAASRALAIDPTCTSRRTKVVALAGLGRWVETLSAAEDALRVDIKDLSMLQHKIIALEQLNQWERAFAATDEALIVSPQNIWIWRERVRALGKLEYWVLQVAAANQALAFDPQNCDVWHLKTEGLEKLGRWTEALFASERALELFKGPHNWHYKFHKAQVLDRLGRLEEAVAIYQQVLAVNADAASKANLASALERLRRTKVSSDLAQPRKSLSYSIPQRVHISYERETASGDEIEEVEIPFVVGVIADFAGNVPAAGTFAERTFFDVNSEDFDACFRAVQPRLSISVTDKINDTPQASGLQVDLKLESLADFTAEGVIAQVPPLVKMVRVRDLLQSIIPSNIGSDGIDRALDELAAIGAKLTPESAEYEAWSEVRSFADMFLFGIHELPPLVAFRTSIDHKLSAQLETILHAPDFQRLEATWLGLKYLADIAKTDRGIRVRAINASKKELVKDLIRVADFDQSHTFRKIIGPLAEVRGEPFSLMITDYEFGIAGDDLSVLGPLARVAEAAQTPLLAAAAPNLVGVDDFKELSVIRDLTYRIESPRMARWHSLRKDESLRYLALTLPRVLMRLPYNNGPDSLKAFEFEEKDGGLWGNGAYAVAGRILAAFAKYGWCAEICGHPDGLRRDLPVQYQDGNDDQEWLGRAEIVFGNERNLELNGLGFIVIRQGEPEGNRAYIDSAPTCCQPNVVDQQAANDRVRLSIDLRYILALSRFMHFLAMRIRDRTGGFVAASELESFLNRSLSEYVAGSETAVSPRQPLISGWAHLIDKPGARHLVFYASPAYQLPLPIKLRATMQIPNAAT